MRTWLFRGELTHEPQILNESSDQMTLCIQRIAFILYKISAIFQGAMLRAWYLNPFPFLSNTSCSHHHHHNKTKTILTISRANLKDSPKVIKNIETIWVSDLAVLELEKDEWGGWKLRNFSKILNWFSCQFNPFTIHISPFGRFFSTWPWPDCWHKT